MRKESGLALALVLFAVLACEPSNNNRTSNPPGPAGSPPPSGVDDGPISDTSGPGPVVSGKFWERRSAYEAYDDQAKRRQGSIGPCGQLADTCIQLHEDWKQGRATEGQFLYAEQNYFACCNQYYPGRCGTQ
ncbi:MAG TPA: hypothetical protein VJT71_20520 [Pyrinomonadaceae bacterium]|nr:hypothetical protein [Pyrinomonadaceae bacterium]